MNPLYRKARSGGMPQNNAKPKSPHWMLKSVGWLLSSCGSGLLIPWIWALATKNDIASAPYIIALVGLLAVLVVAFFFFAHLSESIGRVPEFINEALLRAGSFEVVYAMPAIENEEKERNKKLSTGLPGDESYLYYRMLQELSASHSSIRTISVYRNRNAFQIESGCHPEFGFRSHYYDNLKTAIDRKLRDNSDFVYERIVQVDIPETATEADTLRYWSQTRSAPSLSDHLDDELREHINGLTDHFSSNRFRLRFVPRDSTKLSIFLVDDCRALFLYPSFAATGAATKSQAPLKAMLFIVSLHGNEKLKDAINRLFGTFDDGNKVKLRAS